MAEVMEQAADVFMDEALSFPADDTPVADAAKDVTQEVTGESAQEERGELTIKFAKGLCGEPFTAKDGKEYVQIKIPEEGSGIWPSFVLPANHVHENQYGKGLWAKIPEDGTTKIKRTRVVGEDQIGKKIYDSQYEKVDNKTLKAMVEAYKEKNKEAKPSITDQLKEPKATQATPSVKPPVAGGDAR